MFKPTRMRWRREIEGEEMFRIEIGNMLNWRRKEEKELDWTRYGTC